MKVNFKRLGFVLFFLLVVIGFSCSSVNATKISCYNGDGNVLYMNIGTIDNLDIQDLQDAIGKNYCYLGDSFNDIFNGFSDCRGWFLWKQTKTVNRDFTQYKGQNIIINIGCGFYWNDLLVIKNYDGCSDIKGSTHYLLGDKDYRTKFTYKEIQHESMNTHAQTIIVVDD